MCQSPFEPHEGSECYGHNLTCTMHYVSYHGWCNNDSACVAKCHPICNYTTNLTLHADALGLQWNKFPKNESLHLKKWPPMVPMTRGDKCENKDNNKWAEGEWKNNSQSLWGDQN